MSFALFTSATPLLGLVAESAPASPISVPTALLIILGIALIFVAKSVSTLRARVEALEARPAVAPAPAAPVARAAVPQTAASDAPPPEILAVIAAAVHVALEGRGRVIGVRPVSAVPGAEVMWSLEGRRQIFHSHKVR